ncbi:MAG TPA: hypothetical protein VF589_09565 [Allosphingosinicella sp.]|jgi:hypothetical protein
MLEVKLTEGGWFEGLPASQSGVLQQLLADGSTEEQVAELWLSTPGAASTAGFGAMGAIQSFYHNVKREFVAFACGDARYEDERAQALQIWKDQGKVGLVSMVAAIVASTVGLAAAAVVPVIALLFSLVAKVGLNAFCASCAPAADGATAPPA